MTGAMEVRRMDELELQISMTPEERQLFQAEMARRRKSPTTAVLLTFFLGAVGAHRFYLGEIVSGFFYALFCWTFIPLFLAVIELFTISGRVSAYNEREAMAVAARIRALTTPPAGPTSLSEPDTATRAFG